MSIPMIRRLRGRAFAFGLAASGVGALAFSTGSTASAQEHEAHEGAEGAGHGEGEHAAAGHEGGHAGGHVCPEHAACTASSSAHECECYWETSINWWSWDYKATPAQAPEHRHMPPPFGFALINFAVFAAVMYRLAAQPLRDFVRTRHTTIRKDLDEAQSLFREADSRLKEYQAKISGIDGEIDALLAQVKREAEVEKARIIASAEEQAKRMKLEADRQIRDEIDRARRELKSETVAAATAIAEKLLAQLATPDDGMRLAERFVTSLETGAHLGTFPGAPPSSPPAPRVAQS